ncbi:hypothetical protein [Vreelandella massiliensis]|uniref:hypothetical protein n=1 Tax=Vreelandella massiliensis TaxID=1816686 RepID=UPI00096A88BA|nr:hypothetical protein [Halomonas massiliensis]
MPFFSPRCSLLALTLALAGCASTPTPPTETPDADSGEVEQRPTPERDQITHTGLYQEGQYDGETSRLSGHFEKEAGDGRYAVQDAYLLGDRDTLQTARRVLTERLKKQALEQAGVYRAFEERLTEDQQLSATSVLVSGSIVKMHGVEEEMRAVGNDRVEMVMQAVASVDSSGLQQHLDALYDNNALAAANEHLQRENLRLRSGVTAKASPDGNGQNRVSVSAAQVAAPDAPATMAFGAYKYAADLAPWLKKDTLAPWLHDYNMSQMYALGTYPYRYDWVEAFEVHDPSHYNMSYRSVYKPEGVEAIPQQYDALDSLRRKLSDDMSSLIDDYNAALDVRVLSRSPSPNGKGTRYKVAISGFSGFVESLLDATGLPFAHGQLTPEQIEALDPWSALNYWVLADKMALKPLMLTLRVNANMDAPGRESEAAAFHQAVLSPVVFNGNRRDASLLAFSPLEHYLWYLGGRHLPNMGLKAPQSAYEIDGERHSDSDIPSFRRDVTRKHMNNLGTYREVLNGSAHSMTASFHSKVLDWFQVEDYDPAEGKAIFAFTMPNDHPPIESLSAVFERKRSSELLPLATRDPRKQYSQRDMNIERYKWFF